jgi:DNA-binding MarR family transcriptional regulator
MRNISTAKSPRGQAAAAAPNAEGKPALLEPGIRDDVGQIIETIIYLYTESRRITKELARRAQLTGPQLTVVKLLETIGDLSLTELSEKIRAQNSTVTGIIDRMEREGLVLRERSKEDRRVVKIRLTPKGMDLARDVPVEPMVIFRTALESLSKDEMQDLLKILLKVSRRVKAIVRKEVSQP